MGLSINAIFSAAFRTTIISANTRPRTIGGRDFERKPKDGAVDWMSMRAISAISVIGIISSEPLLK